MKLRENNFRVTHKNITKFMQKTVAKLQIGLYIFLGGGNHMESNFRVCAALKWKEKLHS